jgi:secreted Zn-dependent insulinase-like peptidase
VKKLPDDAFAYYLALGTARSHQAVADHFDVDKKTVTNRAVKETWKDRIAEHERKLREEAEKKAHESVSAMDERQLRVASYIQAKAIEALKAIPIDSAMDGVKAYKLAVEMERMIRGHTNKETAEDIEKKIRGEHERWLVPEDETADDATDSADNDEAPVDGEPSPEAPAPSV